MAFPNTATAGRPRRSRAFLRKHPRTAALAIGLAVAAALVAIGEGVCFVLLHINAPPEPERIGAAGKGFMIQDELLGYKPKPNVRERAALRRGGRVIFDTVYSTDKFSRRVTPVDGPAARSECALFFGGSYTFGEGVADGETLPAFFGALCPRYRPYNYGCPGYGPQQMLAKLQSGDLPKEVGQRKGIAVYTFMRHHVARAIGDMHVYTLWGADMPYYTWGPDGGLVRDGSFRTGRPWTSLLYGIVGRSQIAKYFHVCLPPRITSEHIRLTAKIIEESRIAFERQFQSAGFFVVLHPAWQSFAEKMRASLEGSGVVCLDYSGWWQWRQRRTTLPGDSHPNARGHFVVAQRLAHDVRYEETRE